ncbi:MAG: hypothetical protein AAF891_09515 [Pseudomonadota bacterium]
MTQKSGGLSEWLIPLAFVGTMAWVIWHLPAFMLDWIPYTSESLRGQVEAIYQRSDVTPGLNGLFGGYIDILDMLALILSPVLAVLGARAVKPAAMEFEGASAVDRAALFIGRVTMMMIAIMTIIML